MICDSIEMRYGVVRLPSNTYNVGTPKCGSFVGIGLADPPYVRNSDGESMVAYMLGK